MISDHEEPVKEDQKSSEEASHEGKGVSDKKSTRVSHSSEV